MLKIDKKDGGYMLGIITSAFPLGCMLGVLVSTGLPVMHSKRLLLMWIDVLTVVVVAVSLYANLYTVVASRLMAGVVLGINVSTIPVYIRQISPISMSGAMGSIF